MTHLAAATATASGGHSHTPAILIGTALALFLLLAYPVSCWWFPFADCRVCKGTGLHRSDSNRRHSRICWWCRGARKRLRWGRRLFNALNRRRQEADR